ncbi:RHS repeat-associated core domain-containing protein, partial [bacterium]|nr:RHS repeat-associated core domain-containing protein [bacterium]
NLLTKTFVPKAGSGLANTVMTFTYDPVWRKVKTAQDGRLNTTTYSYDAVTGSLLTIQRPLIGGFTPTETYTYNGRGQLLTATDPTGLVVKYSYDVSTEKLISKVVDFGGVGHLNLTYSYTFDAVGNLSGLTNPNGNQTLFAYNNARQMTQRTEATPFAFVSNYQYDKNGLLTRFQKQVSSAPTWQTVNVSYTLTEQPYQLTDPLGRVTTFAYDGADRRQSITDAEGRVYQYAYDQLNRLMTVTDPSSTISDTRTYSANGKLASVKDANNNTTLFAYDGFDRLGRVTFADTSYEERTSYDANSNILTFRTRSGNTITNTYDVLNRLSTKAPTGQPTVTYTYDLANRRTKVNKPTVAGDPSTGDFQLFYDTAGRFVQEQYPDTKTVTHVLDSNGNKTKTTWPDGYFVSRVFDQLDRLTDIKLNGSGSSAVVFAYDQLSRRSGLTLSSGASSSYTYDLDSSLVSLNHAFVGSSVNFLMGYNNVAQQVSVGVSDPSYVWHPGAPGTVTYGTADAANKYPSVGGVSYSYDGNKNLTGDGTWTFAYDTENHLLSANKSGVSASYVYDPMHRQAQKTVGSAKTRFIYSGSRQIAEYDGVTGNLLNRYVFAGSDQAIIQITSGGTVSFFHQDRQGSVIATTNSSGVVTNSNSYSPFGQSAAALASNFGFTGQRFDQETGLYYFKARHYSPEIGRFLQPDLVGYSDGLNMFTYVGNDPLNKRDSTGMFSTVVDFLPFEQFNRIFDMIIGGTLGGGGEKSGGKGEQPPPVPGDDDGYTGILVPGAEDLPLFNDSGTGPKPEGGGGTAVEDPPTTPEPGTAGGGAGEGGGGDDNGGRHLPPDGNDDGNGGGGGDDNDTPPGESYGPDPDWEYFRKWLEHVLEEPHGPSTDHVPLED